MFDLSNNIEKAVQALREGEVIAFPTETVYGLGADARNRAAVEKVFEIKGRPKNNPLIVHLESVQQLNEWACDIPDAAYRLAEAFWPGPMTLVLRKQSSVLGCVTAESDTVAVRVPRHPVARSLLASFGSGIAAPSANKYTRISPTQAAHVRDEFGDAVKIVLEGGACEVGLESTIIDLSSERVTVLRPGMISESDINRVLGKGRVSSGVHLNVRAPGMHAVHYAPTKKTILMKSNKIAEAVDGNAGYIIHSKHCERILEEKGCNYLKLACSPTEYARDLYRTLRYFDKHNCKRIVIESVPEKAEWSAIHDRLTKASMLE